MRNQIRNTTIALLLAVPFLLTEWYTRTNNLFAVWPPIDNFIHAFSGLAFAAGARLIYRKDIKFTAKWILIVGFVWELMEMFGDKYIPQSPTDYDPFFFDGIKDITVSFFAAIITAFIIGKKTRDFEKNKD